MEFGCGKDREIVGMKRTGPFGGEIGDAWETQGIRNIDDHYQGAHRSSRSFRGLKCGVEEMPAGFVRVWSGWNGSERGAGDRNRRVDGVEDPTEFGVDLGFAEAAFGRVVEREDGRARVDFRQS